MLGIFLTLLDHCQSASIPYDAHSMVLIIYRGLVFGCRGGNTHQKMSCVVISECFCNIFSLIQPFIGTTCVQHFISTISVSQKHVIYFRLVNYLDLIVHELFFSLELVTISQAINLFVFIEHQF